MATDKRFGVVGVSTFEGKTKLRWANDVMRVKILHKNGHENIEFVNLPTEMTKAEIVQYLKEIDFAAGRPEVAAAVRYAAKKNPMPAVEANIAAVDTVAA